jgi:hypothetical protein
MKTSGAIQEPAAGPLERISAAVDVALFDPQPLVRLEARAYLRNVDLELLLIAARRD